MQTQIMRWSFGSAISTQGHLSHSSRRTELLEEIAKSCQQPGKSKFKQLFIGLAKRKLDNTKYGKAMEKNNILINC